MGLPPLGLALALGLLTLGAPPPIAAVRAPPRAAGPAAEEQVAGLLAAMTDAELASLCHGVDTNFTFSGLTSGVPRLGIPPLAMNDGPQGFRCNPYPGSTTAFPSALSVSATFDRQAAAAWAGAIAREFAGKGANVMLGPAMQTGRVPGNGRRFEYLGGEDPCLGAALVGPVVEAIQNHGVLACAKHYVINQQEQHRGDVVEAVDEKTAVRPPPPQQHYVINQQEQHRGDVVEAVDEKTAWHMYLPPFQAAVEAGVASVMCSYNRVKMGPGDPTPAYACESVEALGVDLKGRMGFRGWVMSDWGATHSTAAAAAAGLDQEMPDARYFGQALLDAVKAGAVPRARLEDMAGRVLHQMLRVGLLGPRVVVGGGGPTPVSTPASSFDANVTSDEHRRIAREVAAHSLVLLKNEPPQMGVAGGGGGVLPLSPASAGIMVVGNAAHLEPLTVGSGSGSVDAGRNTVTPLEGIRAQAVAPVGYATTANYSYAYESIRAATVALVFVGVTSGEGADRPSLALPPVEVDMVLAVLARQPATVVVVASPGPVLLRPGPAAAPAVLMAWMAGEQAGHAVADVLFGRVPPAGRLPVTLPNADNEVAFTPRQYPGVNVSGLVTSSFDERLEVGYRWYDTRLVRPLYPFGHGLSYVAFTYSDLVVTAVPAGAAARRPLRAGAGAGVVAATVALKVSNLGRMDAHEVVQLYVGFPTPGEPPRQLRAFEKVLVPAGGAAGVTLTLRVRDLCVWDPKGHAWTTVAGTFRLLVGASARDIRLEGALRLV